MSDWSNPLFGTAWGNASITYEARWVDIPAGQLCAFCEEPILLTDSGLLMSFTERKDPKGTWDPENLYGRIRPVHRECDLRQVIGGVNHQRHLCRCYGGVLDPDPEGLTKHEAALAAARELDAHHNLQ